MFTWTIGLSAPHPLCRPIWSCECCSISAGWTIQASLICHPASSSISSVCYSVCAPTSWHPCPKWGAKSRTGWIIGDRTPSLHHQGSPQTLGMLTFISTLVPRGQFCLCPIQWWASEAWAWRYQRYLGIKTGIAIHRWMAIPVFIIG